MFRLKHGGLILGIVAVFVVFFYFVVPFEDQLLDSYVTTGPDILLDDWRGVFHIWANLGVAGATCCALIWFFLGHPWLSGLNHWREAGKRMTWLTLLLVASFLLAGLGWWRTPTVQEWGWLSDVFYVGNSFLVYYLATLFFSPPSYKYTPVGAAVVRYW